jgi:uncharacterized surface protein with fasciclin (FAS1) repeats
VTGIENDRCTKAGCTLPKTNHQDCLAGRLEAVLLILVGLGTGWLAIGENYSLLMNPKFRWITLGGALAVCAMGMAALANGRKPNLKGFNAFLLLGGVVLLGNPFSHDASTLLMPNQTLSDPSILENTAFPVMEMRDLQAAIEKENSGAGGMAFSVLGRLHPVPTLDGGIQTVLMRSYMVCCVADAYALGFAIAGNEAAELITEEMVVVSGTLKELPERISLRLSRMGTATFPVVSDKYIIEPARIVAYTASLPTIHERLASESVADFVEALQSAGLWKILEGDGPFTVFAPINGAFDNRADGGDGGADELLQPEARAELRNRLSWHIVSGRFTTHRLFQEPDLLTVHNQALSIRLDNGRLFLEDSRFLFKDMIARNGVVHIIHPALKGFK